MACYKPLTAYRLEDGEIVFDARSRGIVSQVSLPCGRCIGCRVGKSMDWQTRLVHEANRTQGDSMAVCLTYDDEHLPPLGSLSRRDFALFLKRLRKELAKSSVRIRFYGIGEYSPEKLRAHYHALLFGWWPKDARKWSESQSGGDEFISETLSNAWGKGRVTFQRFSSKAAAYCARYMTEKLSPERSLSARTVVNVQTGEVLGVRETEFMRCSRRPGIGARFVEDFRAQCLAHDFVVIDGKRRPLPKYYDRRLELVDAAAVAERKAERELAAVKSSSERMPDRLAVREEVAEAKFGFFRKSGSLDR